MGEDTNIYYVTVPVRGKADALTLARKVQVVLDHNGYLRNAVAAATKVGDTSVEVEQKGLW